VERRYTRSLPHAEKLVHESRRDAQWDRGDDVGVEFDVDKERIGLQLQETITKGRNSEPINSVPAAVFDRAYPPPEAETRGGFIARRHPLGAGQCLIMEVLRLNNGFTPGLGEIGHPVPGSLKST
jgi:hypothetical protein